MQKHKCDSKGKKVTTPVLDKSRRVKGKRVIWHCSKCGLPQSSGKS